MGIKVLIACEESQVVCKAFRSLGHEAYSCDILPCSGGELEWHIHDDVLNHLDSGWDLIVAHPPCTYLTTTANRWMLEKYASRFPERREQRADAIKFFMTIANAKCNHIAIENPVGIMSSIWRKPDQYVHPYHFGDAESKKTGFWLKGLPKLIPTEKVTPEMVNHKNGERDSKWHYKTRNLSPEIRRIERSKTFPGIANAIATQWGEFVLKSIRV